MRFRFLISSIILLAITCIPAYAQVSDKSRPIVLVFETGQLDGADMNMALIATKAMRDYLTDTQRVDATIFDRESPTVARAIMDNQISPDDVASYASEDKRVEVARILGMHYVASSEMGMEGDIIKMKMRLAEVGGDGRWEAESSATSGGAGEMDTNNAIQSATSAVVMDIAWQALKDLPVVKQSQPVSDDNSNAIVVDDSATAAAPGANDYVAKGDASMADENYALAILQYSQAINADPKNGMIRVKLAKAYTKKGLYVDAKKELDKAAELGADPNTVDRMKLEVEALQSGGEIPVVTPDVPEDTSVKDETPDVVAPKDDDASDGATDVTTPTDDVDSASDDSGPADTADDTDTGDASVATDAGPVDYDTKDDVGPVKPEMPDKNDVAVIDAGAKPEKDKPAADSADSEDNKLVADKAASDEKKPDTVTAVGKMVQGDEKWRKGDLEGAAMAYKEALALNKNDWRAYHRLAIVSADMRNFFQCKNFLEQLNIVQPDPPADVLDARYERLKKSFDNAFDSNVKKYESVSEAHREGRGTLEDTFNQMRDIYREADDMASCMEMASAPKEDMDALQKRVMAASLLAQSANSMMEYLMTFDEESKLNSQTFFTQSLKEITMAHAYDPE